MYYFYVMVGDQVGQEGRLGMDFMIPADVRLDLIDGTLCLSDEVRISLSWRRPPNRSTIHVVKVKDQHVVILVGGLTEVRFGKIPPKANLCI